MAELDGNGNLVSRFVYTSQANIPDYLVKNGVTYRLISDHLGSSEDGVAQVGHGTVLPFRFWSARIASCLPPNRCWGTRQTMVSLSLRGRKETMAELTLQVSDALVRQLRPFSDRLPELLAQVVTSLDPPPAKGRTQRPRTHPTETHAYAEVLEFLLTRPTPREIVAFKVSAAAQRRLRTRLGKNREEGLTEAESGELDLYEQLDQMMALLKVKAFRVLKA